MANEIDYDNMTDEQIDDILSQIDSGTFGSDDENQDGENTNLDENNESQNDDGDEISTMEILRTQRVTMMKMRILTRIS